MAQQVSDRSGRAIAALVLGIAGILVSLVPVIGLPLQIIGLILGIQSRASAKRGMAIAGIILCSIGMAISLMSALFGIFLLTQLDDIREKAQQAQDIYNSITPQP